MGIYLSAFLLMAGAISMTYGIHFFIQEKNSGYYRSTLLLLGLFAGIWQMGYGFIGICDNFFVCEIFRKLGLIGVCMYTLTETVLALRQDGVSRRVEYSVRIVLTIFAVFDWLQFSKSKVDSFVRVGNWTTFQAIDCPERTCHEIFVTVMFLAAFVSWYFWYRRVTLKREKNLLRAILWANLAIMIASFPDTILVRFLNYSVPTSGIGAGISLILWYVAAERYNAFAVASNTMGGYVQNVIDEAIVIFDENMKVGDVNRFATENLNIREGMNFEDVLVLDKNEVAIFNELREQSHLRFKSSMPNRDNIFMVDMTVAWDDYHEPFGYIMTMTDISKEEQLVVAAESASKAKSNFLANMSHEIRTPMNTISAMAEIILRESRDDDARKNASMIKNASKSLLAIINDILDFSKIESGRMDLVQLRYDVSSVVNDVLTMIRVKIGDKPVEIKTDIPADFPNGLIGDELRIKQVLINLLNNAVKFTSEGCVELSLRYERINDVNCRVYGHVKDTGVGIKEDELVNIFDSFTQVDTRRARSEEGTGLGLAISKNLLQMMGGDIRVESEFGKGTTFYFAFKNKVYDWNGIGDFSEEFEENVDECFEVSARIEDAKILVVDDNTMNLKVAEGLLKPYGIKPTVVESGKAAIACFERLKPYDIIFMDHMMPGMDGIETMNRIREMDGGDKAVIVALTANAISGVAGAYKQAGFNDYLAKPIEPSKLDEILHRFIPSDKIKGI